MASSSTQAPVSPWARRGARSLPGPPERGLLAPQFTAPASLELGCLHRRRGAHRSVPGWMLSATLWPEVQGHCGQSGALAVKGWAPGRRTLEPGGNQGRQRAPEETLRAEGQPLLLPAPARSMLARGRRARLRWSLSPCEHCRLAPLGASHLCKLSGWLAPMPAAPDVKGRVQHKGGSVCPQSQCLPLRDACLQVGSQALGLPSMCCSPFCPPHATPHCSLIHSASQSSPVTAVKRKAARDSGRAWFQAGGRRQTRPRPRQGGAWLRCPSADPWA